jgi:hypothetical protein
MAPTWSQRIDRGDAARRNQKLTEVSVFCKLSMLSVLAHPAEPIQRGQQTDLKLGSLIGFLGG